MSRDPKIHTLGLTALVNEACLQPATQPSVDFGNHAQVLGIAARMMQRILRNYDEQRDTATWW